MLNQKAINLTYDVGEKIVWVQVKIEFWTDYTVSLEDFCSKPQTLETSLYTGSGGTFSTGNSWSILLILISQIHIGNIRFVL